MNMDLLSKTNFPSSLLIHHSNYCFLPQSGRELWAEKGKKALTSVPTREQDEPERGGGGRMVSL